MFIPPDPSHQDPTLHYVKEQEWRHEREAHEREARTGRPSLFRRRRASTGDLVLLVVLVVAVAIGLLFLLSL